jgi:glycosyltransferase involved in cell wall biosynthesis
MTTGGRRTGDERPRLLYLAMYDPAGQDSAPKVRIRLLGEALARQCDVESLAGGRLARVGLCARWLLGGGMGRVDAVYVESSTSTATPIDLAFLAWARLRGRPVGVYFRDAYQLHRDLYPRTRRRQLLADLAWRVTTPFLVALSSACFAPSTSLAKILRLHDVVLLPPGTESTLARSPLPSGPVVAYVGNAVPQVGFDLLVAAMELVRRSVPTAVLRVVARPPDRTLPEWIDIRAGSRAEALVAIGRARVAVLPLPINRYTDMTVAVKIADYLSLGRPIVATRARETAAFLEGTGAALLVGDTPKELAGGIVRVLAEAGLAERMAAAAVELADRPDVTWDGRARSLIAALLPGPLQTG